MTKTSISSRIADGVPTQSIKVSKTVYVLGASLLFAGLINELIPVRYLYFFLMIILVLLKSHEAIKSHSRNNFLIPLLFLTSAGIFINFLSDATPAIQEVLTRQLILFPLSVIAGYVILKYKKIQGFLLGYSFPIYCLILLIPYELLVGPLLERSVGYNISKRFEISRVAFFSEHPLILAAHLTLIASMIMVFHSRRSAKFLLLLVLSIMSTLSLGPTVLSLFILLIAKLYSLKNLAKLLVYLTSSLVLFFTFLASSNISTNILSSSTFAISATYRAIIYGNLIPNSLSEYPFGYGVAGLREGLFRVSLNNYSVDLAKSIDSQPALLIVQGGWLLLVPYLFLTLFICKRVWQGNYHAVPALISLLLGFFVPMHSFTSTCVAQGILFGVALSRKPVDDK